MEKEVGRGIEIEKERKLGKEFGGWKIDVGVAGNEERMNESSAAKSKAKST